MEWISSIPDKGQNPLRLAKFDVFDTLGWVETPREGKHEIPVTVTLDIQTWYLAWWCREDRHVLQVFRYLTYDVSLKHLYFSDKNPLGCLVVLYSRGRYDLSGHTRKPLDALMHREKKEQSVSLGEESCKFILRTSGCSKRGDTAQRKNSWDLKVLALTCS